MTLKCIVIVPYAKVLPLTQKSSFLVDFVGCAKSDPRTNTLRLNKAKKNAWGPRISRRNDLKRLNERFWSHTRWPNPDRRAVWKSREIGQEPKHYKRGRMCDAKKEHFVSNCGLRVSGKNDVENQNGTKILQRKSRFLPDFMRCSKVDKE